MSDVLLTPRDLADAIGASESSVRRWLDAGAVVVTRTAGGHRRVALPDALRFIREQGATVVRPEILGLGGIRRRLAPARGDEGVEELYEALRNGRAEVARGLLAGWYVAGRGLADIFDGPVRLAMQRIGELWRHEGDGILKEHAATVACTEAVVHLSSLLPRPVTNAPVALGGAPAGDFYQLGSMAAAAVLREAGFLERNYGANTPLSLLAGAARERRARLVWVSIATEQDRPLRTELTALAASLDPLECELVVGGRFAEACAPVAANARTMDSMAELAAFAEALRAKAKRNAGSDVTPAGTSFGTARLPAGSSPRTRHRRASWRR